MSQPSRDRRSEYLERINRELHHLRHTCPSSPPSTAGAEDTKPAQQHPHAPLAMPARSVAFGDPRIAPAVQQLTAVAERVDAVWQRMGVASRDRHHKWDAFLFGALLPFLEDFCALQEAAEHSAATENDGLLREVCHLAARLDEVPRQAEVATIVGLLREHYAEAPAQTQRAVPQHDAASADAGNGDVGEEEEKEQAEGGSDDGGIKLARVVSDSDGGSDRSGRGEGDGGSMDFMYLSLPSFTELIEAPRRAAAPLPRGDLALDDRTSQTTQTATALDRPHTHASGAHVSGSTRHTSRNNERASTVTSSAAATQALRRLMHGSTHEGVRQLLQSELDRLQRLAENRLRVLQLLYKQRAILALSAQEQVRLRAAYRAKYLEADAASAATTTSVAELCKTLCDADGNTGAAPVQITLSPTHSSTFRSPPTSPETPTQAGAEAGPAPTTAAEAELRPHATASLQDSTRAELQLLLSAASCSLEMPNTSGGTCGADAEARVEYSSADAAAAHFNAETNEEASGEVTPSSTWPTCSSTTLVSRAQTAASATGAAAATTAQRETILDMDVSSITAYGTHQDLTLQRIHSEAEAILASIDSHNRRMQADAQEELRALDTLEVLWRAMSAQKTSPKTSTPMSPVPQQSPTLLPPEERETAAAVLSPPVRALASPVPSPLRPVPHKESKADIVANFARLHAAYEADVLTQQQQQQQQQAPAGISALPASASSAGSPPSSLTSSTRLSPPPPTPVEGASSGTGGALELRRNGSRSSSGLYLPPLVRQVLRAASYAPVLDYVHRARVTFQRHLSIQQDALVEKTMARLRDAYNAYYAATRDKTYAAAPDGELRVAMEEELLETLQAAEPRRTPGQGGDAAEDEERRSAAPLPSTPSSSGTVLLSFQRHLQACQQVREQAADEVEFLRLRLHIIEQAAPLVQGYQEIVREEAEMRATSRERLLNKKVNMAKQLLQEEKTRRRVAKELPRIVGQLRELVAAWDALQAATEPREDNHASSHGGADGVVPSPSSDKAELWIRGQRVRDLLSAPLPGSAGVAPTSRVRSRSASNTPQPMPTNASARSVSPAVPASRRPRTEPPHQQQRLNTPLSQRSRPHAAPASSQQPTMAGRGGVASVRSSPAVRARTPPPFSQPSARQRALPQHDARGPPRSPQPLLPTPASMPQRRGLTPVPANVVRGKSAASTSRPASSRTAAAHGSRPRFV